MFATTKKINTINHTWSNFFWLLHRLLIIKTQCCLLIWLLNDALDIKLLLLYNYEDCYAFSNYSEAKTNSITIKWSTSQDLPPSIKNINIIIYTIINRKLTSILLKKKRLERGVADKGESTRPRPLCFAYNHRDYFLCGGDGILHYINCCELVWQTFNRLMISCRYCLGHTKKNSWLNTIYIDFLLIAVFCRAVKRSEAKVSNPRRMCIVHVIS